MATWLDLVGQRPDASAAGEVMATWLEQLGERPDASAAGER